MHPFASELQKKKIGAAVFLNLDSTTSNPAFTYFSHFTGAGALIITKKGQMTLITPKMEYARARKVFKGRISLWKPLPLTKQIYALVKNAKSVGIDGETLPLNIYKALKKNTKKKLVDVSKSLVEVRLVKTKAEQQAVVQACRIGDKVVAKVIKNWKRYKTESDVAAALRAETAKLGYKVSFDPIVASGKNASIPHHEPKNKPLQRGFCVIDYGVFAENYASDMTRTIYLGKPTLKERETYLKVLKIQESCIASAKPGCKIADLVTLHDKELKAMGYTPVHALGHGVGIEIHEDPILSKKSKQALQKGMVIAIEPGVYMPNKFGIRIEDTIVVDTKPRPLTKTTKKLIIV